MATPIIDHNLLTLDYWQDSVTYEGKTVPGGTIGCEALNIPDTLREKLAQAEAARREQPRRLRQRADGPPSAIPSAPDGKRRSGAGRRANFP